jgi:hypothetical protein
MDLSKLTLVELWDRYTEKNSQAKTLEEVRPEFQELINRVGRLAEEERKTNNGQM